MKNINTQEKYYPMIVKEVNESDQIFFARWEKYGQLPQKNQDVLSSEILVRFIYGCESKFYLLDEQTEEFSRTVRQYFFQEITEDGFVQKIAELCRISPQEAMTLLRAIKAINPKSDDGNTQEKKKNHVQMTLMDALAKYPRIKEQILSEKMIASKPFLQPLKPTLKNWIMVYEKVLGVSRHSAIERGEFIFRADATRYLHTQEKELLADILRSRDENSLITIDVDVQRIIHTQKNNEYSQKEEMEKPKNSSNFTQNDMFRGNQLAQLTPVVNQKPHVTQQVPQTPRNDFKSQKQEVKDDRKNVSSPLAYTDGVKKTTGDNKWSRTSYGQKIAQRGDGFITTKKETEQKNINNSRKHPLFDTLQKNAIINRNELRGKIAPTSQKPTMQKPPLITPVNELQSSQKMERQIGTPVTAVSHTIKPIATHQLYIENVKREESQEEEKSAISGTVKFSSNHVMPVEKITKKTT